jgi:hypothetical protein
MLPDRSRDSRILIQRLVDSLSMTTASFREGEEMEGLPTVRKLLGALRERKSSTFS